MGEKRKDAVKNSLGRAAFVVIGLLLQICWILALSLKLNNYDAFLSMAINLLAVIVSLKIYGKHMNASIQISWMMLILVFPVFGLCLYFLCGRAGATKSIRKRFEACQLELEGSLLQEKQVMADLSKENPAIANQAYYMNTFAKFPIYRNTDSAYYADASDAIAAQKDALREANQFIFMEYHAIEDSESFHEVEAILVDKVQQGVEVRLFYDDMGSIGFISPKFIGRMERQGIQCRVFNPLLPVLNVFMNNRDHRKITVIDGVVGFTGGYNIADEYFNITRPYGHWKDTGIKLTGEAVRSLTVMFLEMWNAMQPSDQDYKAYLPQISYQAQDSGLVQPYADSPLDEERVGENVYLNIIKNAKKYLYVMTPYLILDDEMTLELNLAAKRGVDVRIITPGIPDKKLVYSLTRSYYAVLVRGGVQIYEYTPGFLHAKQMICDDEVAVVGTINMDFRSLYLHFENAVYLYRCSTIKDILGDFRDTFQQSQEVSDAYRSDRSTVLRIGQCMLRLLAPMM